MEEKRPRVDRQSNYCAYRGCMNGKYTTKSRLYRFPGKTDYRLAVWLENSGNKRLKVLAPSTLRSCGLCENHFEPNCFVGEDRRRLTRHAVPKPYTDTYRIYPESSKSIVVKRIEHQPILTSEGCATPISGSAATTIEPSRSIQSNLLTRDNSADKQNCASSPIGKFVLIQAPTNPVKNNVWSVTKHDHTYRKITPIDFQFDDKSRTWKVVANPKLANLNENTKPNDKSDDQRSCNQLTLKKFVANGETASLTKNAQLNDKSVCRPNCAPLSSAKLIATGEFANFIKNAKPNDKSDDNQSRNQLTSACIRATKLAANPAKISEWSVTKHDHTYKKIASNDFVSDVTGSSIENHGDNEILPIAKNIRTYKRVSVNCSESDDENCAWVKIEPGLPSKIPSSGLAATGTATAIESPKVEHPRRLVARLEAEIARLKNSKAALKCKRLADQKKTRSLLQKLRRTSEKNARLKILARKETTDEFLDRKGCLEPAARTMVKLQVHRKNAPYSEEEQEFAKQLFTFSATIYTGLRDAGCSFPAESSVRTWISEDKK